MVQRGTCGHRDSIGFGARYLARRRRSRKEIRDNSGQDPLESLEVDAPRAAEPQAPTAPEAAPDVTEGNLLARLPPINWMDPLPLLVPALSLDLIVLNLEVLRGANLRMFLHPSINLFLLTIRVAEKVFGLSGRVSRALWGGLGGETC